MVCPRCIQAVRQAAEESGLSVTTVTLGQLHLEKEPEETQVALLDEKLETLGFERIQDSKEQWVSAIKNFLVTQVHYSESEPREKTSVVLSKALGRDYSFLSNLFSEQEGTTIEQYIIQQRIEKVKELLSYGGLTLSEIGWQMGYSSVAHLSAQFKKVTGMTPSEYKRSAESLRKPLDF